MSDLFQTSLDFPQSLTEKYRPRTKEANNNVRASLMKLETELLMA